MSDIGITGANGGMRSEGNGSSQADGDSAQSPKEMVAAAASTLKQEVATFASSVQDKAQGQVEDKKQIATKTMGDFASAIRHAGEELAQHDQSAVGRVVKHAADGLEQLTRTVSEKRPEELLDAVREFGRSNPTAFIAGSVLLGVALGRFARSTENHQLDDRATYVPSQDFGPRGTEATSGAAARSGASDEPFDPAAATASRPDHGLEG